MVWGSLTKQADKIGSLKNRFELGQFEFVLGFNEPDSKNQSDMSVDAAIEQWRELEAIGAPLISPSTVTFDNAWMQQFMHKAHQKSLVVEYLGFHWFGEPNPNQFLTKIDEAYQLYGLPIWITEFAVADWSASEQQVNRWSAKQVQDFMRTVLPELDNRDYVYRYAWFNGENEPLISSALIKTNGELTELGNIYSQHTPNLTAALPNSLPVIAIVPDNLVKNGNFEDAKNSDAWISLNVKTATFNLIDVYEGYISKRLNQGNSSIVQAFEVEPHKSYELSFYSMFSNLDLIPDNMQAGLTVTLSGDNTYIQEIWIASDSWQKYSIDFPTTDPSLTLTFAKQDMSSVYLDDIRVVPLD